MDMWDKPVGDYLGAYRAMEDAYREGKVRAIGVVFYCYSKLKKKVG